MIVLIPIFFVLTTLAIYRRKSLGSPLWQETFIWSALVFGLAVIILTEGLNIFRLLSFTCLTTGWAILIFLSGFAAWKNVSLHAKISFKVPSLVLIEKVLLAGIIFIFFVVGFVAFSSAPNTWDSMTYHLPRVMHWIQDHTLEHYPTNISRQLSYCPFAEYFILQSMVLAGNDHWVNFVQFFAMIGSGIGVYTIAGALGAGRWGRILGVFFAAALPMGILQGSSTQTDYVATFWLVCFFYCVLRWQKTGSWNNALWVGISLGLAFLTKGYTYLYALPLLFLIVFRTLFFRQVRQMLMAGGILIIALTLNSGYYARNLSTFGVIYGNTEHVMNTHFGPRFFMANVLRNAGSALVTPWPSINMDLERSLGGVIQPLDASSQKHEFHINNMFRDEDYAGNILHLLLWLVTLGIWFFFYRRDRYLGMYVIFLFLVFIGFVSTVAWQPWICRFHLPFFILACPWMGVVWERIPIRWVTKAVILILFLYAQLFLFYGTPRPLLGKESILKRPRLEQYFIKRQGLSPVYNEAIDQIYAGDCRNIGILGFGNEWEYPLWVLLGRKYDKDFRMEYIGKNKIADRLKYPLGPFSPCAVVTVTTEGSDQNVKVLVKMQSIKPAA